MHEFKHPNYYKELRKRNKSDQVISKQQATASSERAPGPGLKPQAASIKQQAIDETVPHQEILEAQAASNKPQAPSSKPQASSRKRQAP